MFPLLVTANKVLEWGGRAGCLNGHWACHHTEWTACLISHHVFFVFMFPLLVTAVRVLEWGRRAGWLNGHWTCHHTEWTACLISHHVFFVFMFPLLVTAAKYVKYDPCCTLDCLPFSYNSQFSWPPNSSTHPNPHLTLLCCLILGGQSFTRQSYMSIIDQNTVTVFWNTHTRHYIMLYIVSFNPLFLTKQKWSGKNQAQDWPIWCWGKNTRGELGQYNSCWCPGSLYCQVAMVLAVYDKEVLVIHKERFQPRVISVSQNYRKCKHIHMLLQNSLACKPIRDVCYACSCLICVYSMREWQTKHTFIIITHIRTV